MTSTAHRPSNRSEPRPSIIVEEVLGSVLAPDRLGEMVGESLGLAALPSIPEDPTSLRVFVEGALFATLARHLEVSDALELVGQIRSSLELALQDAPDDRPSSKVRSRLSLPASPDRVLVVTQASLVVFLLQDVLGDGIEVMPLSSTSALRDRLRQVEGQSVLVVVDRKHPCAGPGVCEELRSDLSDQSIVVWWGAHGAEQREVTRRMRGGPQLIACEFDLSLADLGELCSNLLGDR